MPVEIDADSATCPLSHVVRVLLVAWPSLDARQRVATGPGAPGEQISGRVTEVPSARNTLAGTNQAASILCFQTHSQGCDRMLKSKALSMP